MFALVTHSPRLRVEQASIQSNPVSPVLTESRSRVIPLLRARRFTSSVLLKNNRSLLGTDPKIRAKRRFRLALPSASPTFVTGGADRDRTDDPLLAKQVLSQLSYSPPRFWPSFLAHGLPPSEVVGLDGFEPSTPALSRRCSNQLSYRPDS